MQATRHVMNSMQGEWIALAHDRVLNVACEERALKMFSVWTTSTLDRTCKAEQEQAEARMIIRIDLQSNVYKNI